MVQRSKDIDYVLYVSLTLLVIAVMASLSCKGDKGSPGVDGINGLPGTPAAPLSVSITTLDPGGPICVTGGSIISVGNSDTIICNGEAGAPGVDATPISFVQFCGGTTGYPDTFAEVGICVNGIMYGVYSRNGGFLSQLPQGLYSSEGINSTCSFNIGPDCQVTR